MREESEYRFPENTPLPVILESVDEKEIPYTDKKTGKPAKFTKWEWVFQITEGEFAGLRVYGETEPKLTNHPDNKVRQWAETLRDAPFEIGEGLNTDDLLGLPAVVTVFHGDPRPKKDGTKFYPCPVQDVFPEGTGEVDFNSQGGAEAPF